MSVNHVGLSLEYQYAPEYSHYAHPQYVMSIHEDAHILENIVLAREKDGIILAHRLDALCDGSKYQSIHL